MKRVATLLIVVTLALLSFGLVMLYSVSPAQDSTRFLSRQLMAGAVGVVGAGAIVAIGYRRLRPLSWLLFGVALALLAAVLVVGVQVNGARRWFRFGAVQFQPSDFAKLALVAVLAHYGAYCQRLMRTFRWGLLYPGLLVGPVIVLVFLEPDWGTAILLAAVSVVILIVAGVRWLYLLPPLMAAAAGLCAMLALNPVRSDRVYSWLHLEETRQGVGYQAWHAKQALQRGALFGVGLNNSREKRLLPEHQTDFLFAIVAEEWGFVGSSVVIVLFLVLFMSGIVAAWRAPDSFGMLLGTGMSFLIGLQTLINLMVVSGAAPNKGLALPFISYGGSNLAVMLICTGVLVSVALAGSAAPVVGSTENASEHLAIA